MDVIKQILQKAGQLYFQPISITGIVPATTGTGVFTNTDNLPFLISDLTVMVFDAVTGVANQDYLLNIKDLGKSQTLTDSPIHGSHWGLNGTPTHMPIPYWLKGAGSMEFNVTSLHAGNNLNAFISISGYKLPGADVQAQAKALIDKAGYPYWFSIYQKAIAGNTTQRLVMTNTENKSYIIKRFTAWAYDKIAAKQTMNFSLYMKDSATQKLWMPNPVNGSAFGFNGFPTDFMVPYKLNPQASLEVELTVNSANATDIFTAFFGYRVSK